MLKAKKILFISQEITPYVPETRISKFGHDVAETTQSRDREIRTFMPKWGVINERRNQLHEVIRLSGMNIIVDDTDHPLIIKVASIPYSRMQVYFIDNDDYFSKRRMACDADGVEYDDNAERAVFFARGVLETVKKLKWVPDVIHCQGWITSVIPLYIKTAYAEEPSFRDSRIVYTPSEEVLSAPLPESLANILQFRTATIQAMDGVPTDEGMQALNYLGIKYSDGVAMLHPSSAFRSYAKKLEKPYLPAQKPENFTTAYPGFYDRVWSEGKPDVEEEDD